MENCYTRGLRIRSAETAGTQTTSSKLSHSESYEIVSLGIGNQHCLPPFLRRPSEIRLLLTPPRACRTCGLSTATRRKSFPRLTQGTTPYTCTPFLRGRRFGLTPTQVSSCTGVGVMVSTERQTVAGQRERREANHRSTFLKITGARTRFLFSYCLRAFFVGNNG